MIRFINPFDYSLFVSTFSDKKYDFIFLYRKIIPYIRDEKSITGIRLF